ncbi:hypothetical protein RQP46_003133 [Phenoliferia psychrophenolica]
MLSSRSSLALALLCSFGFAAAAGPHERFAKVKRDDDWSDSAHCPGGSIGDADKCTFEVTTVWSTPLKRWTQYGSWTTTNTFTEQQSITVNQQQAGNINLANDFYMSTGNLKINYGSTKGGHYEWYQDGIDVFTLTSDGDTYSANVGDCGAIFQPTKGTYYYNDSDYDAVKAGDSTTYTYDN